MKVEGDLYGSGTAPGVSLKPAIALDDKLVISLPVIGGFSTSIRNELKNVLASKNIGNKFSKLVR